MYFYCEKCKKKYPISSMNYRCECGGMFHLNKAANEETVHDVTIGHMHTDLLSIKIDGIEYLLKTENLLPTGSFKDRGAYTLINEIRHVGIEKIALDSAGNAGASIAAHAAAAGIDCTVYVPKETSPDKLRQIAAYGAKIVKTEGGRMGACQAVKENLGDAYYASHVYNPLFADGIKSMAHEIYHQLGDVVPDYIFVPIGNGSLLLGLYQGFAEIGRLPHFVGVQSTKCAPVVDAFHGFPRTPYRHTIAETIRVEEPPRMEAILWALRSSQGDAIAVEDGAILTAAKALGECGIYAELTAAAALAGARAFFAEGMPDNYRVIVPIPGSGLKR